MLNRPEIRWHLEREKQIAELRDPYKFEFYVSFLDLINESGHADLFFSYFNMEDNSYPDLLKELFNILLLETDDIDITPHSFCVDVIIGIFIREEKIKEYLSSDDRIEYVLELLRNDN